MGGQYKISSKLFLYLLSNLPTPDLFTGGSPDLYELVLDDEVLAKEVVSWVDIIRGTSEHVPTPSLTIKVDIGPFCGVFPFSLKFDETPSKRTATVDFSIDFYNRQKSVTWKDWFILEEDKGS